jgi:hypothetical protein
VLGGGGGEDQWLQQTVQLCQEVTQVGRE